MIIVYFLSLFQSVQSAKRLEVTYDATCCLVAVSVVCIVPVQVVLCEGIRQFCSN